MIPITAIASIAGTAYGAIQEGKQRRKMDQERQKWSTENEAIYNQDYHSDYLKRADSQSVIKNMRDEMKKQNQVDQNVSAVTGASPEVMNARKERRNKAMTNLYSNISANGAQFHDRAKGRYLARKQSLQGMENDIDAQKAMSANNLLYNGLNGLATTDWASMVTSKVNYNKNGIEDMFDDQGNLLKMETPKVGLQIKK